MMSEWLHFKVRIVNGDDGKGNNVACITIETNNIHNVAHEKKTNEGKK